MADWLTAMSAQVRNGLAAPTAESESQGPSTKRITLDEAMQILVNQYGETAASLAQIARAVTVAESRTYLMRIQAHQVAVSAATLQYVDVPNYDWRTIRVSRPTMSEIASAYAHDIYLVDQDGVPYQIGQSGVYSIPVEGLTKLAVLCAGGTAPSGAWYLDLVLSNRAFRSY